MNYDVIIIGAGIIGGAVARELSRYNLKILALEKEQDVCCGISKANTGIIHSPAFITPGTLKAKMTISGFSAFDKLSDELGFRYQKKGALLLAYSDEEKDTLERYIQNGIENYSLTDSSPPEYRILSGRELRAFEPELSPDVTAALFLPDVGRIIPYEYGIALWENAVKNGVELKLGARVTGILKAKTEGLWRVSVSGSESFSSEFVVNAAGHGSNRLGLSAGFDDSGIQKVKGQYIILEKNTGPAVNHILFQVPKRGIQNKGKGILVTRTVYGNIMIGPDAQWQNDEDDTSTDLEALYEVIDGALESIPGLDISKCIKTFAGVRPKPSGGDFIIQDMDKFIHLCGIESPGITSSPAIAVEVVQRLEVMGLSLVPGAAFQPRRRPIVETVLDLPPDEVKRRVGVPHGDHDRLICRCEQVPELRIMDAANRGIPVLTLDGIKRRTRAGQGRCQGAFCGPRVRSILSSVYGIPEDAVSQRGTEPEPDRISAQDLRAALRRQ